ncbi:hypothetical protein Mspyr1_46590 [Mycolicibacterium gilvum Spyr1]|uniref:SNF2 N-terminal domain-containing protein n=1 Tax=Mycolicibacterium gilvum (strain DSM 45189 / LMG 24558 / Spyr1) TaxID=278137 RepID=E6TGN5_MYCSR|nr:hypothetical protein Mspyr1_46590 [Mycolicibacterium gilvum Spyr1]
MLLEELKPGLRIDGLIPAQVITVIFAQWHGTDALELTYKTNDGALGQQVIFRKDQDNLTVAQTGSRAFDANATDFKMVAEAQRITLAGLFDPMLAVATSDVRPLPHQIRAVYGELLPRTPLRFLLADDPGAGKTIMAGLYIKELLLRDDVRQCLIVAPGGLVEQWQDELFFKFGLRFDLLTNQLIDANVNLNVFETNPLLIARMDQLSRNEELQAQLAETEWDLIIVDFSSRGNSVRHVRQPAQMRLCRTPGRYCSRHTARVTEQRPGEGGGWPREHLSTSSRQRTTRTIRRASRYSKSRPPRSTHAVTAG